MTISEQYANKICELNDELEAENAALLSEIARLRAGIQRIDGINDSPAVYNPDIEAVVRRLLDGEKG